MTRGTIFEGSPEGYAGNREPLPSFRPGAHVIQTTPLAACSHWPGKLKKTVSDLLDCPSGLIVLGVDIVRAWQVCTVERPAGRLSNLDIENLDVFDGLLLVRLGVLDGVDDVQALHGAPKDGVLVVKPGLGPVSMQFGSFWERACHTVFSVVMKNWLPLVLGPALAMLTV